MSGVQEAIAAAEAVAPKKSKFKPVGMRLQGYLIAQFEDVKNGNVEEVEIRDHGNLYFRELGRSPNGEIRVFTVKDKGMRKMAKAMLDVNADFRHDAMTELQADNIARVEARLGADAPSKNSRRKR